ncbi:MAG TPA: hypothetical protein VFI43_03970 [Nitrosospira sp.]|nr:hypothetical protein [Nitrosospira sp.]
MIKFVPYVRTIEGYIERQSYAVFNSPDSKPMPYVYEEELAGWPETKVFWASKTGPSLGLAPLANSSSLEQAPTDHP